VWQPRRPLDDQLLTAAALDISAAGRRDGVPLESSAYWSELMSTVNALGSGAAADELRRILTLFARATSGLELSLAPSHGDWTPWNMAAVDSGLLVWDWERYRPEVPLGFDVLHFRLQRDLVTRRDDPAESARRMVGQGVGELRLLGVPARDARATSLLYGADLAARYLTDRQLEAGARLGDVGTWLLPALAEGIATLGTEGD
jgi:hypothetical protein